MNDVRTDDASPWLAQWLRSQIGERLPGGCDDCTATHEYREDVPDIIDVLIHHDETCPQLQRDSGP